MFPTTPLTKSSPSRLRRSIQRLVPPLGSRAVLAAATLLGGFSLAPRADAVVTFVFTYTDAAGTGFNDPAHPEYKMAVETAGQITGGFFMNAATITIAVTSTNDAKSSRLASAGSPVVSPTGAPGFYRTVVQDKVINNGATDLNGAEPDGSMDVNLGASFQFDANAPVGAGQIDFVGTAIHELTHALGFSSNLEQTPNTQPGLLSIFDSFLTDDKGEDLVKRGTFIFHHGRTGTLTGGNNTLVDAPGVGGVFFSGPNAKAAFGGNPVPIFSPSPYQTGSSISHLDDNTTALKPLLMAAAAEAANAESIMMGVTMPRVYGAVEKGIMTDLGYTLN